MAKKSFNQRVPIFKWVLLLAFAISIPVTLWSLSNQTQTKSNAFGDSDGPSCVSAPTWTLVSHTDYTTSVKYKLTLTSKCPNITVGPFGKLFNNFGIWAKVPAGWSYLYQVPASSDVCAKNQTCAITINGSNSATVYLTVSRPSTAKAGTYTVPIYADNFDSPTSTKNLSYIVIK